MSEWPKVCESSRHLGRAIPATGYVISPWGDRHWYCRDCSFLLGAGYARHKYHWEPLPERSQAQPTSERVQP